MNLGAGGRGDIFFRFFALIRASNAAPMFLAPDLFRGETMVSAESSRVSPSFSKSC